MPRRLWLVVVALTLLSAFVGVPSGFADHGRVLQSDTFNDPGRGLFPLSSSDPQIRLGYVGGEYQVAIIDPNIDALAYLENSRVYSNVAMAFDVRFVSPAENRYASIGCRSSAAGNYRLSVDPAAGSFTITVIERSGTTTLRSGASAAIRRGSATNRIEFACTGQTLTATVNASVVASVQDSRLTSGSTYFGIGSYTGYRLTADARFDNWILTDASTAGTPPPPPAAPPSAVTAAHRLSGVLSIAGETAPANVTVTALIGDTVCGTAQTTAAGAFSLSVLSSAARAGCGQGGRSIRIGVRPRFGEGWIVEPNISFQSNANTNRNINVDLRRLSANGGNVPWTREGWEWPFGLPVGVCDDLGAAGDRGSAAGLAMWVTAYRSQGFGIELVANGREACAPNIAGIAIIAADFDEPDTIAATIHLDGNLDPCDADIGCRAFKALIAINPAVFNRLTARDQAATIAHEIGHALGLEHAATCNGGTIMWEDTACRFPRTHIGVDDIASLNERYGLAVRTEAENSKLIAGPPDAEFEVESAPVDLAMLVGPRFLPKQGVAPRYIYRPDSTAREAAWTPGRGEGGTSVQHMAGSH